MLEWVLVVNQILMTLLSIATTRPGPVFPDNWLITLLSSLAMLTGVVLFTAALDVWLKRILGPGEGPVIRRSSSLTLPAGADPNAEPRGRLVPREYVGRSSGGSSQMNARPDRHRRVR